MKKISKIILLSISIIGVIVLSLCLLPSIQKLAVEFVESYKHDDINDSFWKQQMFAFSFLGIITILITNLVVFTEKGMSIFTNFCSDVGEQIKNIKNNKKYLFILVGLYFLGYYAIIKADFWNYAIDDLPRKMEGSREWVNFYRYFSEIGSIFIHTSRTVFDIAPLTQYIALFFVALASYFAISIFTNNKFSVLSCISSLPIGLFPFFLSNFSYRYDSPYMALSLLISVIPFLFITKRISFIISSVLCLLIMCTSYQASSGIYIFMTVLVFLKKLLIEKADSKTLIKLSITTICCYALTLLLFSFLFIEQSDGGSYVDESLNISKMLPNAIVYLKTIFNGLGKSSTLIFSIITICLFIFNFIKNSVKNKFFSLVIVILALAVSIPMTYGAYLGLGKPEFISRTFIGIGVFIGCLSIINISFVTDKKCVLNCINKISAIVLSYCVLAFSYGFGNAQYDQKEYIKFRAIILAQDLSEVLTETNDEIELLFINDIGVAPSVDVLKSEYPLVSDSVDIGLRGGRNSQFILQSLRFCKLIEKNNHDFRNKKFPILKETSYHLIQGKNNQYLITFKNPNFKVIKTRNFIEESK